MFKNSPIYILMLTSGFLGSFGHCLGMCGPVVSSCSVAIKNKRLFPHLLYNLGRVSTYSLLGGIVGMTGSALGTAGHFYGVQKYIMLFAGISIILLGAGLAGWLPIIKYIENRGTLLANLVSRLKKITSGNMNTASFYSAGVLMGFIPCGLVYTALLTAAGAGMGAGNHFAGFLNGTLIMFLFGIGTMPAMLLLGKIINTITIKMRATLYRLSAIVMIMMGIIFIIRAA
jgi:sulfite exporter TauE/SafE